MSRPTLAELAAPILGGLLVQPSEGETERGLIEKALDIAERLQRAAVVRETNAVGAQA